MPPAKIDCGLIVFDLNSNKKEQLLSGLIKLATFKWFSMSKDLYRIILANSKVTSNEKNTPNLYTTDIEDFSPASVLQCIENAKTEEGNWLDALLLAIYHLKEATTMSGLLTPKLLFFTSLDESISVDEDKLQSIIKELQENNIYLYIIGPDVKLPCMIKHPDEVSTCMKRLVVNESNKSLVAARRIVQNIQTGVICDVNVGLNLINSFRIHPSPQLWKMPISFGTQLGIASITVKIYKREMPLRLIRDQNRRTDLVLVEDQTVTVNSDEILRGVLQHGKFIKIEDMDMFRADDAKCFDIIGFTDKKFVPETYMRGEETFFVLPNHELVDDNSKAFNSLVSILANQSKYGILKRVNRNNTRPKYFVLIPQTHLKPVRFVMVGLPYADDVKPHKCVSPVPSKVKVREDDFTRFIRSIDVSGQDPKVDIPLAPTMMLDPYVNKLVNSSATKLLQRDFDFENVDLNDCAQEGTNKFLENLRQSWPERES